MAQISYEAAYDRIHHSLNVGIVKIEFTKVTNGRFRIAYGTLNPLIVEDYGIMWEAPQASPEELELIYQIDRSRGLMRYFDLQRPGWRCFKCHTVHSLQFVAQVPVELPYNATLL